jgi:glycosyltransferase involved in cell wall biosynthesis
MRFFGRKRGLVETVPPPDRLAQSAKPRQLFTLVTGGHPGSVAIGEERATIDQVARWRLPTELPRRCFRYRRARAVAKHLGWLHSPLKTALLLRVMARGRCWLEDDGGARQAVTTTYLGQLGARWLVDRLLAHRTIRVVERQVELLRRPKGGWDSVVPGSAAPLYLRSDLVFDVDAGGAVAHISGVVNNLRFGGLRPIMVTTAPIPLVAPSLEVHVVRPSTARASLDDVWRLAFNEHVRREVHTLLRGRVPALVYHRSNAYSYAGALIAHDLGVPLVLEYNGSDAWISRNWGSHPISRESLVLAIEELNLRAATLVVVVSQALAKELVGRGVPADRVLVVPNGVDPERFNPTVDGSLVRSRYGVKPDEVVVGFVGTFGAWHGAEVLARAFALAVNHVPLRLLYVGDGSRLPATRLLIEAAGLSEHVIFAGLVPQTEGPAHMAACDILVAPHIPNPDGTPFFGSPTKLFEYMAMGKAVVASDLDQLGQVVANERNGILVPPSDERALAAAIAKLARDPEMRRRLGQQARRDAVERHTWRQHADRIVARLEEVLGAQ